MPPVDRPGERDGPPVVVRDEAAASTRLNAELLRGIMTASEDCIQILDLDGTLAFMNEAGRRAMDVADFEAIRGRAWPVMCPDALRPMADAALDAARAGATGHYRGPTETFGGTPKWWDVRVTPILGLAGTPEKLLAISRDLTPERTAEVSLREAQALNALILESSQDCIVVLDLEGHTRFVSPGGIEAMEISTVEAIIGLSWLRVWTGPDRVAAEQAVAAARAGRTGRFQGFCATHRGTPKWWDVVISPLAGQDGQVTRLVSIGRDITASHRAQAALRTSEAHWRGLFERLQEGIVLGELVRDASEAVVDWRFLDVNSAWGDLVGIAPGATIGRTVRELLPGVEDAWVDQMAEIVATRGAASFTRQVGTLGRWYEGRAFHLDEDRFAILFLEVTARKRAEVKRSALLDLGDRLRDLTEPRDMAYVAAEIVGKVLGIVRAGFGLVDPARETVEVLQDWTMPGVASLAGTYAFREFGSYIDDLKQGRTVIVADTRKDARTAAAAQTWEAIGVRSLVNYPIFEQGHFVAVHLFHDAVPRDWRPEQVAFAREVADRTRAAMERSRAEAALRRLNEDLEQRVQDRTAALMAAEEALRQSQKMEAVGQLTGGLAHDFNNLLTGISGSLERLQSRLAQGRADDLDRYIVAAQEASRRAAALTHRLLAFSRRQTLDPKPTDVARLLAGMTDLIGRTVGPGIGIETVTRADCNMALVDPNQLENAILNLSINARDAMPAGGRLTLATSMGTLDERTAASRDLAPGPYLSICVSDTGTGMPPDVVARAFDPFFTTKPIGMGTGLGLSMVYGFARQSGGGVRIHSAVGEGTTVCIDLPRHDGPADARDAAPAQEATPRAGFGETVLVIDDEPTVRMLVVDVLSDLGYAALEAQDGPSGLKVLQTGACVDLLVTDVGLPGGMNGRQVADAARALRPGLKVLFITGYAENAVLGNGDLDPGMAILVKPFAMDDLASRLRMLIEGGPPA